MAEAVGISGATSASAGVGSSGQTAASAAAQTVSNDVRASERVRAARVGASTTFSNEPVTPAGVGHSKVVQRLLEQNATVYARGLARLPLPARADDTPRAMPKKPAGPMTSPRSLDAGRSPLAPHTVSDARQSVDALGTTPDSDGSVEGEVVANAREGAHKMPSRHGLVAYTTTARGDRVYLTQERWQHIREHHMDRAPEQRGKRTTTYWPTKHAVNEPTMSDAQVIGVIVDAARKGVLRTEVRDTRMAEYDLPQDQADAFGVSEAKVSMAPDGLVLSAYPAAGHNVLAVYELSAEDQAALERATSNAAQRVADLTDRHIFRANAAPMTAG